MPSRRAARRGGERGISRPASNEQALPKAPEPGGRSDARAAGAGSPTGAPRGRALARNFDAEAIEALRRILARHRGSVATITARRILKEMGLGFTSARASAILATIRTVHEVDGWRLVEEGRGERVYLRFARKLHCPVCGAEVSNVVSHCLAHVEELCRRGAER